MKNNTISSVGDTWENVKTNLLTLEEQEELALKVALIGEIIKLRESCSMSQKDLEAISGVKQPVIARLEKGNTDPQLSTLIKILAPMGKTLAIVPIEKSV